MLFGHFFGQYTPTLVMVSIAGGLCALYLFRTPIKPLEMVGFLGAKLRTVQLSVLVTREDLRGQAKELLERAEGGDDAARREIVASLQDSNHPLHGVYRVRRSTGETVLRDLSTIPGKIPHLKEKDQDGHTVWRPSVPAPLNKE